jgi:hypothetical protein
MQHRKPDRDKGSLMRTLAHLLAASAIGAGLLGYGQSGDPKILLQQRLSSQFTLTGVAADRSSVVNTGTLLTLKLDNLEMYSSSCPSSPLNTYNSKKGTLSQPFGKGFLRDLGGSMKMAGGATTANCPQQRFAKSTQLWVTKIEVQKDGVLFRLFSTPAYSVPYYGDLKFPFEKGTTPAPDQARAMIAEVLTVQQAQIQQASPPAPAPASLPPALPEPLPPPAPVLKIPALYVNGQTPTDTLQLNADNSFSLQEAGQTYHGTFVINGNTIEINIPDTNTKTTMTTQGNNLTDPGGQIWALREQSAGTVANDALLKNDDIIRMAKAHLDDAIIVGKIGTSKCQFDTSTDALIQLKQNGVSAAVLKAIMGAGK